MNINAKINYVFASKRENPKKFFRVQICGDRSVLGLPETGATNLKKAVFGEFQNGRPIFTHRFDSADSQNQDYRVSVVMRQNKELAYYAGYKTVDHMGYICCDGKKDEDDEDLDVSEGREMSDRIFCGVFTTEQFTVLLAIGEKFEKSVLREIFHKKSEPELWDALNLLGQCSEKQQTEVIGNVEE